MARMIQVRNGMIAKKIEIDQPSLTIGRSRKNTVCIKDEVVSGVHAEIFVEKNEKGENVYFIQDLQSTNGLYLNKNKITCKQLRHKDKVRIGRSVFTFLEYDTDAKSH